MAVTPVQTLACQAAAIRALLVCAPRSTDWYEVHRQMWISYGDPGDLAAMTDQVG